MSEVLDQLNKIDQEGPSGGEEKEEAVAQAQAEESSEAGEETSAAKYKIGEKEFSTEAEAFQYAEQIQREADLAEARNAAYRQGILESQQAVVQPQNVTQNVEEEDDTFNDEFYADPKEALARREKQLEEKIEARLSQKWEQQSAEEQTWSEFFQAYPDLSDHKDVCETLVAQHTQDIKALVTTKGRKAAMDYLAQKVRGKFQSWVESNKPRRELPSTSSGPTEGSHQNVTRKTKEPEVLDFAAQIKQNRMQRK